MNYSRQREEILNCLKNRKDHPTAEEIYMEVRESDEHISKGTVYRNLSQLALEHSIQRIVFSDDASVHFDYDISSHAHFFCRKCGRVIDADLYEDKADRKSVSELLGAKVEESARLYYGICRQCLNVKSC